MCTICTIITFRCIVFAVELRRWENIKPTLFQLRVYFRSASVGYSKFKCSLDNILVKTYACANKYEVYSMARWYA